MILVFSLFVICLCLYAFNVKIPHNFKKKLTRESIRNVSQVALQKIHAFQRYRFLTKVVSVLPIFMWLIVFQLPKWIPNSMKPTINTTTLPQWELLLTFGVKLQHWPASYLEKNFPSLDSLLDVWAGILYFVHFFMAGLFALLLYIYVKTNTKHESFQPWTFFFCFGIMNLLAVINQLAWPTAPPWWVDGNTGPASYEMKGDPAVLADVDQLLGYPFFANIWSNSPIVFGSFPSLHGAWPFMIALFAPTLPTKILGFWYTASVWWAAVFLNHHYLIDLLGGLFYCLIGFFLGRYLMYTHILPKFETESQLLFSSFRKKTDNDIESNFPGCLYGSSYESSLVKNP